MTESELATALERLLPEGVVAGVASAGDHPLFPEEASAVVSAVPKRRHDFAAGRLAARRALARLGRAAVAIPSGPRRAPTWPAGTRGSLSHAGGFAIAAVTSEPLAVGVDLEVEAPLAPDVEQLVLGPRDRLAGQGAMLAFSAKESVYKALFPEEGWLLEFGDVTVEVLGPDAFVAMARWSGDERSLQGRFARVGELLVTVAFTGAR